MPLFYLLFHLDQLFLLYHLKKYFTFSVSFSDKVTSSILWERSLKSKQDRKYSDIKRFRKIRVINNVYKFESFLFCLIVTAREA